MIRKIASGIQDSDKSRTRRILSWFLLMVCALVLLGSQAHAVSVPITTSESYRSGVYYQRLVNVLEAKAGAAQKERLVEVAMSQKGYNSSPASGNFSGLGSAAANGPGHNEYSRWCGVDGYDWCAAFVSWCGAMAGIPASVIPRKTVARDLRVGTIHKVWSEDFSTYIDYRPRRGDLMFATPLLSNGNGHRNGWDLSAHVAIVAEDATARDARGGWIFRTIERSGNTVGQRTLSTKEIAGGTSASGTRYVQMFVTPAWQDIDTSHDPQGYIDSLSSNQAGRLTVKGWAFDMDAPSKSIPVHVYVGNPAEAGEPGYEIPTNVSRPDVNETYRSFSLTGKHGFDTTISVSKSGPQTVYFYAINVGSGEHNTYLGCKEVTIRADVQKPSISNIRISNVTADGYTVSCTVKDNVEITQVMFPTWTVSGDGNGQDDLIWHEGTVLGNTASYTVKRSLHNNEFGTYVTHIYAYDLAGNSEFAVAGTVELSLCAGGHSWNAGSITKQASCSAEGTRTYTCKTCGATKTEKIAKTAHTPGSAVRENVKAATCTAAGSYDRVTRCTICRAVLEREKVSTSAAGHRWDSGTVTRKATTTAEGIRTYTCTVCHAKRSEKIPVLSNDDTPPVSQAPYTAEQEKTILKMSSDEAPSSAKFHLLQLKASKVRTTSITLKWKKVKDASGYIVYGNRCGKKYKKLKTINSGSTVSWTKKGLKKGTYYKFFVVATTGNGSARKNIAVSQTVHIATMGGKVGNARTVKVTNLSGNKKTLKVGKTFSIKAKAVPASSSLKVRRHRTLRYESSNPAVASVGLKSGKIKAKKTGSCTIYVYAQNGVCKSIRITVR